MLLPVDYYLQHDLLFLSKDLLGKFLLTHIDGVTTGGMIIETEAYRAPEDRASHAFGNRKTKRNTPMFKEGGICYIYQCYGMHALFNIVTNVEEVPHAILIRAILPSVGIEKILERRGKTKIDKNLAGGPGMVAEALGLTVAHNGLSLLGPVVWIEDRGETIKADDIVATPRVGVDYAGEDAFLLWRFRVKSYLHLTKK